MKFSELPRETLESMARDLYAQEMRLTGYYLMFLDSTQDPEYKILAEISRDRLKRYGLWGTRLENFYDQAVKGRLQDKEFREFFSEKNLGEIKQ